MDAETKVKSLKTNQLEVDDMEILSTGKFNIPSGNKYEFQENGVTTLEIDAGILKLTNQPLFISTMTAEPGAVTGNGTAYTCAFDTEVIDTGSGFSTSTYKFTAPLTGVYDFNVILHYDAVTNAAALVDISLVVEVAGAATHVIWLGLGDPLAGTGDELILNASKSLLLTATATVKVVTTITGEGADTCVVKAASSQFSGRLVTV